MLTQPEAAENGFTHEASYYGLPVYIGNLEFCEKEPITITTKYAYTDWLFTLIWLVEWLFTPPGRGIKLKITKEL